MIAALIAFSLAQTACNAPVGAAELFEGDQRFVIIGETHGTTETPAAFAALACEAAARGPVLVALELPRNMQPQLNAFLDAESEEQALDALAGTWFLNPRMNDGRTSRAMLGMLHSIRGLKAEGSDIALYAFQPDVDRPRELPQSYYELDMGYLLSHAAYLRPDAKVLALVGNIHARKTGITDLPSLGLPAAGHLPPEQTTTLHVPPQGGEAWNCRDNCGPHASSPRYDAEARGLIMGGYGDGAYDGVLALGPSTASPPIADQPE